METRLVAASAVVKMRRASAARVTCAAMNGSPCSMAATAPRCMKVATPELEYWTRFSINCPNSAGASIQPTRQPVMAQFFEKELTKISGSPSAIASWKEGARAAV